MDALFDETELLLADSIAAQIADAIPTTVDALESFDDSSFWSQLADGDLLGLGLPESVGGLGTSLDCAIVTTALGRATAPVPYLGCAVLPAHLLASLDEGRALIDEITGGGRRVAVAFNPELTALGSTDEANIAWDAAGADAALVAGDSGEIVLVALDETAVPLDLTRRVSHLPRGGTGAVLGRLSHEARERWMAVAMVAVSADLVGVMSGGLDLAVDHAKTREQFGGPIGRFQAVQHLVADSYVDVEGARGLVNYAAWAIDNLDISQAVTAARVAKAYCSEKGKAVTERVIQVHGGMGMTWECLAHLHHRRAVSDSVLLGDERTHYQAIAASAAVDEG